MDFPTLVRIIQIRGWCLMRDVPTVQVIRSILDSGDTRCTRWNAVRFRPFFVPVLAARAPA